MHAFSTVSEEMKRGRDRDGRREGRRDRGSDEDIETDKERDMRSKLGLTRFEYSLWPKTTERPDMNEPVGQMQRERAERCSHAIETDTKTPL